MEAVDRIIGRITEVDMPDWKEDITRRLASLKLTPVREAEITEEMAQHVLVLPTTSTPRASYQVRFGRCY